MRAYFHQCGVMMGSEWGFEWAAIGPATGQEVSDESSSELIIGRTFGGDFIRVESHSIDALRYR